MEKLLSSEMIFLKNKCFIIYTWSGSKCLVTNREESGDDIPGKQKRKKQGKEVRN